MPKRQKKQPPQQYPNHPWATALAAQNALKKQAKPSNGTGFGGSAAEMNDNQHIAAVQETTRRTMEHKPPRILGQDGKFCIVRDAMGVPGLHVAVNVLSPNLHKKLFEDHVFTTNAQNFVENQTGPPLKQCILHPTTTAGMSSPWPNDWHRLINAVRDCGLFEEATIPDNAYALTYAPGSEFCCHHDGRGKWGEYVICCSLGNPCTLTFQHGAPKRDPFDPEKPWNYVPPEPPSDAYWTRSMTEEPVDMYKRKLWQVSMTLPPNSFYVMSGASRYDWRHGINVNQVNHPLPKRDSSNTLLFPFHTPLRRAVIFRSTKVFSDYSLQVEHRQAVEKGDMEAAEKLDTRVQAAKRFPAQDQLTNELTPEQIAVYKQQAQGVLDALQQSSAHRLRFQPSEVLYDASHQVRAVADLHGQDTRSAVRNEPEVIEIDDSSDDEEAPPQGTAMATPRQDRRRPANAPPDGAEERRARMIAARRKKFGW